MAACGAQCCLTLTPLFTYSLPHPSAALLLLPPFGAPHTQIRTRKHSHHKLVTTGLYALCRHPSYVGWFMWSVGTQVLLSNPVCFVGFNFAAWAFFANRIPGEEALLLSFFGNSYAEYQKRVPLGIPFIRAASAPDEFGALSTSSSGSDD